MRKIVLFLRAFCSFGNGIIIHYSLYTMFTPDDLSLFAEKGIDVHTVEEQLSAFEKGFPYLKLKASASVDNGILLLDEQQIQYFLDMWEGYLKDNHKVVKFVPASGAASRMFKDLFSFLSADYNEPATDFEKHFFSAIANFAFYADLDAACLKNEGKSIADLIAAGEYKPVVANLLESKGLNYGSLPKGLLKFHHYTSTNRTAMEEHLTEGALYAASSDGEVNIHFTVSHEHIDYFKSLVAERKSDYEKRYGVRYHISFSEQKSSTDTIAADMNNEPFRENGKPLFRPGGHGALIENLNDIDAEVIFVKNIDNVVPDKLKDPTVLYKKVIGGVLVSLQAEINRYIVMLKNDKYTNDDLKEMVGFLNKKLFIHNESIDKLGETELVAYLLRKFDRPIRVCGMVRNSGEPGGGPFVAYNPDGTASLQILESSQIDMANPESKAQFELGTHFNPVDLVCAVRDYKGDKYELPKYVDKNTGFISFKSKSGRELKALELPGLWNGAMSDWNTVFVEVPAETFNPVKTVNDLLRPQHQ